VYVYIQQIPLGVTFSIALSKLKAQSSNVSLHWNVAKETFELWALSFRKCHPKWDWLYFHTYICVFTYGHMCWLVEVGRYLTYVLIVMVTVVWVYMNMYMYVYIYWSTCICIHIYNYIYMLICGSGQVSHMCLDSNYDSCVGIYEYVYMYVYIYLSTCVCMHICIYTYMLICGCGQVTHSPGL